MNWPLSRFIKLPGRVAVLEGRVSELESKLAALLARDPADLVSEQRLVHILEGLRQKVRTCPTPGRREQIFNAIAGIERAAGEWIEA